MHSIKLEEIISKEIERPYCLEGGGACPPEDCGGLGGYEEMLQVLNTPSHPRHDEYLSLIGLANREKWDSKFCNVREVNKRLCLLE